MRSFFLTLISLISLSILLSCTDNDGETTLNVSGESFMPMHVGNYWSAGNKNHTIIIDTIIVDGDIYYEFYRLVDGWQWAGTLKRIDKDQNLININVRGSRSKYVIAKFNASDGDTFYQNEESRKKVEVIKPSDSIMTFKFPSGSDTYIKGQGLKGIKEWDEYRIDKIVYKNKESSSDPSTDDPNQSFLPMQIGNYWIEDSDNHTTITDTLTINGKLFYKFHELRGGDMLRFRYMRIDEEQNLIEKHPDSPDREFLIAKFNANVEDTFFT